MPGKTNMNEKKKEKVVDDLKEFHKKSEIQGLTKRITDKLRKSKLKHYGLAMSGHMPSSKIVLNPKVSVFGEMFPAGENEKELVDVAAELVGNTKVNHKIVKKYKPKTANDNHPKTLEKVKCKAIEKKSFAAEDLNAIENILEATINNSNRNDNKDTTVGAARVVITDINNSDRNVFKKPNISNSKPYSDADYSKANYSELNKDNTTSVAGYSPDAAPQLASVQGASQKQSNPYTVDHPGFRKNLGRTDPTDSFKVAKVTSLNSTKPQKTLKDVIKKEKMK